MPPTLNEFTYSALQHLDFKPDKNFGQNFLISDNVLDRIIRLINPVEDSTIVEIGGGFGALTIPLASTKAVLHVYEIDTTLKKWLSEHAEVMSGNVTIHGDFLKEYPPSGLSDRNFKLTGNIPYQITSPILEIIFDCEILPSEVVLMVQREFAERIESKPHSKERSRITIWCEYHAEVVKSFDVKPGAFFPAPNVGSRVLHMLTRTSFPFNLEQKKEFFNMVKRSFSMKRKTLTNNLAKWRENVDKAGIDSILRSLDLDTRIRAEELTLDQFLEIYKTIREN
jgi:16S rRNA (adenine1518-N6/adenine1519-N6)-dimethyltransferase